MLINVIEYLESTAAKFPQSVALVDRSGSLTFSELLLRAQILAGAISSRTAERNQPIAVFLPKSKECIVAFAAVLYTGNCYAPLDTKSPAPRLLKLIEKLGPALIITNREHARNLRDAGVNVPLLDFETGLQTGGLPASFGRSDGIDTDPAYILHTSGSTGVPKGVVISHRSIIDYIEWARERYKVTPGDTIGSQSPFHFDNSTLDIYLCFSTGAKLVLIPEEHFLFPVKLVQYCREMEIKLIFWVPSVLAAIANTDAFSYAAAPGFEKVLFAGEVVQNKHLNYWRRALPNALFSNLYGPTEITVDCTYYVVDREFEDDEPLPIGFPCRNSDVLILSEDGRKTPDGERGELCVRGSSLALGYWNDPEKTASAFVQNPLNPHYPERIYRTGDIVYRNQRGEIEYVGRVDNQIKHMGYRIELGEIESAAVSLPEVRNVCALYDRARTRIVMFYEAASQLDPVQIRSALLKRLPKYMTPSICLQIGDMPLNGNGKIDRKVLEQRIVTQS